MNNPNHSEAVIRAFIVKTKKERYLGFVSSAKNRGKFTKALAHFHDFDPKVLKLIPPNSQNASRILGLLKEKGAPRECFLISESQRLDNKSMELEKALEEIVGFGLATIVSCIPGKLAYYEGEEINERYILENDS